MNFLTFKDLSIRRKFILFSIGTLFWLVVIGTIGLVTMVEMSAKSKWLVDVIEPQQKTGNIIIRKLRGASISAHKMVLSKDDNQEHGNYLKAKNRLEDCRSYLNVLLTGGRIMDYSRGTGQFYADFQVVALDKSEQREFITRIKALIDELESSLEGLNEAILNQGQARRAGRIVDKLSEYDSMTRDIVTIVNDYTNSLDKEWINFKDIIKTRLGISIIITIIIFIVSVCLSGAFGFLISIALSRPISAIITQIKALATGEIDLTKKLEVTSKDEIGQLSLEFNRLMDAIGHEATFKNIIEEDETAEDIYLRLGKVFVEHLGLENTVIFEVSNSRNKMRIVFPPEAEGTEINCKRDIQVDCELCRTKRTGHTVSSLEYPDVCKYFTEGRGSAHICMPIIIGGNVGGIVQVVCSRPEKCEIFDMKKDLGRAQQYISEVQPVLEAKRLMRTLKESATKDALTGFYNRRFLEESCDNIVAGTLRRGTTLGLLMCDLDFFKQTNDVYGHDVGDLVLKETASNIGKSVRNTDIVIRYGGEEFLVLLVDTKPEDAMTVAEKIRETLEETKVKMAGGFIQKTISIGVSEFPSDTQNFWECVKFADVALYKAKETGRNRVVRFALEMWTEDKY